jgi:hypothetical protein
MSRFGQVGIALAALGVMIALMGLFPGMTGIEQTPGIGVVQVIMLLMGDAMLVIGALIYVKYTFYFGIRSNLAQQIGIRLSLTGLLFASLAGLSDILGFGSHIRTDTTDIFFGWLQGVGIIAFLTISSLGVLIYTIAGNPQIREESLQDDLSTKHPTGELPSLEEVEAAQKEAKEEKAELA